MLLIFLVYESYRAAACAGNRHDLGLSSNDAVRASVVIKLTSVMQLCGNPRRMHVTIGEHDAHHTIATIW